MGYGITDRAIYFTGESSGEGRSECPGAVRRGVPAFRFLEPVPFCLRSLRLFSLSETTVRDSSVTFRTGLFVESVVCVRESSGNNTMS